MASLYVVLVFVRDRVQASVVIKTLYPLCRLLFPFT